MYRVIRVEDHYLSCTSPRFADLPWQRRLEKDTKNPTNDAFFNSTPPITNMEPENAPPLEKEKCLQTTNFGGSISFSGGGGGNGFRCF